MRDGATSSCVTGRRLAEWARAFAAGHRPCQCAPGRIRVTPAIVKAAHAPRSLPLGAHWQWDGEGYLARTRPQ